MAALGDIGAPVLVLAFEHDMHFPPASGRIAASALPHGQFAQVAGATDA